MSVKLFSNKENKEIFLDLLELFHTLRAHSKQIKTIIDVGAYKGKFSQAALCIYPGIENVYCFEPNQKKLVMKFQIIHQKALRNIHLHLGVNVVKKTFYSHRDPTMNSTVKSDKKVIDELFHWDDSKSIKESEIQAEI